MAHDLAVSLTAIPMVGGQVPRGLLGHFEPSPDLYLRTPEIIEVSKGARVFFLQRKYTLGMKWKRGC